MDLNPTVVDRYVTELFPSAQDAANGLTGGTGERRQRLLRQGMMINQIVTDLTVAHLEDHHSNAITDRTRLKLRHDIHQDTNISADQTNEMPHPRGIACECPSSNDLEQAA